jgi:uncharacterized protein YdhG (YjbR/CyaY superfamily)
MAKTDYKSVDAYIAFQPAAARPVLERVRATIRKAVPKAEESISYQIAAYKLNGYPVLYFAGFKSHVGVYPITGAASKEFAQEIEPFLHGRATLRFPLDEPLPTKLIAAIAKFRAKEALAPRPTKKTAKKKP